MLKHMISNLSVFNIIMLITTLILVLLYEIINGFHDSSNSVAIIIYTKSTKTKTAILITGILNFFGVIFSGLGVAYSIVYLWPFKFLLNMSPTYNLIMLFSVLLGAIFWNLLTWYLALPASSSHTLIGAIIGVGIMNSIINNFFIKDTLNISKVIEIIFSLFISPLIGFILSIIFSFLLKIFYNSKNFYEINLTPNKLKEVKNKDTPSIWIRIFLIISSMSVSFFHGANDGQKGVGFMMLILICINPVWFSLNINAKKYEIIRTHNSILNLKNFYDKNQNLLRINILKQNEIKTKKFFIKEKFIFNEEKFLESIKNSSNILNNIQSYLDIKYEERNQIRELLLYLSKVTLFFLDIPNLSKSNIQFIRNINNNLLKSIEYSPLWIIIIIALSLSIGTMIGWKRVSNTISKKIGKKDMTYAQSLSAQITTTISIGIATYTGVPVSTTQVLSSAITGAMIVNGYGVRNKTIKSIILTWFFTLPISILFSSLFYLIFLNLI